MLKTRLDSVQPEPTKFTGIYRGVIEDNSSDPYRSGRVKIRIFGLHTPEKIKNSDHTEGIPTEELPWAEPALSLFEGSLSGFGAFTVPLQGSHVFVFFENGNPMKPIYFASAPGIPKEGPNIDKGFNDPEGSFPNINRDYNYLTPTTEQKSTSVEKMGVAPQNYPELKYEGKKAKFPEANTGEIDRETIYYLELGSETIDSSKFSIYVPVGTNSISMSINSSTECDLYASIKGVPSSGISVSERSISELETQDRKYSVGGGGYKTIVLDDYAVDTSSWESGKWIRFKMTNGAIPIAYSVVFKRLNTDNQKYKIEEGETKDETTPDTDIDTDIVITLTRIETSLQGTKGTLTLNNTEICKTLELPWKNNTRNVSCIPIGEYNTIHTGSKYWVKEVPNRSGILIHSGNVAGSESDGYITHSNGCIILGERFGELYGQLAILNSKNTISKFLSRLNWKPFRLKIENDTGTGMK